MRRGLLLVLLVAGCAYYNGMYNAKRLAGQARKAERDGRTFEATNLWGQVAIKAESAAVRHPRKGWSDEARLLHGTALVRLRDCPRALVPLEVVMWSAREPELRDEAAILVGECRQQLDDPVAATAAYGRLLESQDPARRGLALYHHGRALRLAGRYEEALAELARTDDPRARGERGAALVALGRVTEAVGIAESLVVASDSTAPWDTLLAWIGSRDLEAASAITDRVAQTPGLPAGLKGRLLVQDAARWLGRDSARAEQRLQAAETAAHGTSALSEVRFEGARARISRAGTVTSLRNAAERLDDLGDSGPFLLRGARLRAVADRLLLLVDSAPAGSARGDLRIFLAGELARDSLESPRLAATLFRRLPDEWPESPFAPKALLALIPLEPESSDSLRTVLLDQFATSPYVALIQDGESPRYQVLEDSLRQFAIALRGQGRPPVRPNPPRPSPQPQPVTPRQPVEQ